MTHDVETLKELFSSKFELFERYFESRTREQETALSLARQSMEKRLDSMNEFREQLKDQTATLITRNEVCLLIKPLTDKQEDFSNFKATAEGKASQSSVILAYLISAASLVLAIIGFFT